MTDETTTPQHRGVRGKGKHLQSANCEDGNEAKFLLPAQVQAAYDRDRQNDDGEVGEDVDACVGEPHCELVEAFGSLLGPKGLHRYTFEYTREDCPEGISNYDSHGEVVCDEELPCREDAFILE